VILILHFTAKA